MDPQLAIDAGRDAIRTCLMVGGPILLVTLVVGLLISVLQAMTQLHDQSLSFVPKILLLIVAIGLCLPWLSDRMLEFAKGSFEKPAMIEFTHTSIRPPASQWQRGSDASEPMPLARVASNSQSIRPDSTSESSPRQTPFQDDVKAGGPGTAEPRQDRAPQTEGREQFKSPFILPNYRYVPNEREDLEG